MLLIHWIAALLITVPGVPGRLGPCLSVGEPGFGKLVNGVRLYSDTGLHVRTRDAWGTPETVDALRRAVAEVQVLYPGSSDLVITELSYRHGGHLRPHRTHQSGRDVDLKPYLERDAQPPSRKYRLKASDLDMERLWALLSALMRDDQVEVILLDYWLQGHLYTHCRKVLQMDEATLSRIFAYPQGRRHNESIIRHARGHWSHLHIRFKAQSSRANAVAFDRERGFERLVHVVLRGETIDSIARRYGVSSDDLRGWNGLRKRDPARRWRRLWVHKPLHGPAIALQ